MGDEDSPALVTAVETAPERALSVQLMHGAAKPVISRASAGGTLVRQGEPGTSVYLVPAASSGWSTTARRWPSTGRGAMLGERARLEGGIRTSTLVAVTDCRVASVAAGPRCPTGAPGTPEIFVAAEGGILDL